MEEVGHRAVPAAIVGAVAVGVAIAPAATLIVAALLGAGRATVVASRSLALGIGWGFLAKGSLVLLFAFLADGGNHRFPLAAVAAR